jgi:hypothetical protein
MSDRFMLRGGEALGPALNAPRTIMQALFKIQFTKIYEQKAHPE